MNHWRLIAKSLRFYWRTNMGVVLGSAVAIAILLGALLVGDSVRFSLQKLALSHLGNVQLAMSPQDRFFRSALAGEIGQAIQAGTAPALRVDGTLTRADGKARSNSVQVMGVDDRFWKLAGPGGKPIAMLEDQVVLNRRAAEQLNVQAGDVVLLRVGTIDLLPNDTPLAGNTRASLAFRLTVSGVADDSQLGCFSLHVSQLSPCSAFVPLDWLSTQLKQPGLANMLLIGDADTKQITVAQACDALGRSWQLADADLQIKALPAGDEMELRSGRVFIDPPVVQAVTRQRPGATGVLAYLANELSRPGKSTPYSIVAAVGPLGASQTASQHGDLATLLPPDMKDDQIVINDWLAEDLSAEVGDEIQMKYFVMGLDGRLEEQSRSFTVRAVVPMTGLAGDPSLTPDFPGLAQAETLQQWKTDLPIDLGKIRQKDEQYWHDRRGTPKAFVTLQAGRAMWANRFGDLTAIRWRRSADDIDKWPAGIKSSLSPADLGLFFTPARQQALAGGAQANDLGLLFLGFSIFLIAAGLLLTGLLFSLSASQRAWQVGLLLAMGFSRSRVRRLMLAEGAILACIGGLLGVPCGILYTKAMLLGLETLWKDAVGGSILIFHAQPATIAIGAIAGIISAIVAILLSLRRQAKGPIVQLLAGATDGRPAARSNRLAIWLAGLAGLAAGICLAFSSSRGGQQASAFFAAGALLLVAGLALSSAILVGLNRPSQSPRMSLLKVGLRNAVRHRRRSLATIAMLACGSFLIVAVGANRQVGSIGQAPPQHSGGFELLAESALPVQVDLNSAKGWQTYALPDELMNGVHILPFRLRAGDDASCLNLNRPQSPRLLGARPDQLDSQSQFVFTQAYKSQPPQPWQMLDDDLGQDEIPAVGDVNTITWSLGKSIGDCVPYTDELGRPIRLRLVGIIENSILQGSLIVSERNFVKLFPSSAGRRIFLIAAPPGKVESLAAELSSAMRSVGLEVTPSARRLAELNQVENAYLLIFQMLGGLGMLLGSAGLAMVVLRNVMERRGELAMMRAIGFSKRAIRLMVLAEHAGLLLAGLACGTLSALVAVAPTIQPSSDSPAYASLGVTLLAILSAGLLWCILATRLALQGQLLAALRKE
jgi:putative ABC transport system permease protein